MGGPYYDNQGLLHPPLGERSIAQNPGHTVCFCPACRQQSGHIQQLMLTREQTRAQHRKEIIDLIQAEPVVDSSKLGDWPLWKYIAVLLFCMVSPWESQRQAASVFRGKLIEVINGKYPGTE